MAVFDRVVILLTHGHGDHAGAAGALASSTGAEVWGPEGLEAYGVPAPDRVVRDGDTIETDAGPLVAVHTPGHTPEHLCFHWPARRALFAGDLLLGRGDTTWVAEYPGCVADYLDSLERLRSLDLDVIHPAHGPALDDPAGALDRFEAHRRERIEQVRRALEAVPDGDVDALLDRVYGGELPASVRRAARRSLEALVEYVNEPRGSY
jgi:glyoxylase-like metal-dependent hydrolase (beta-lactamase superfamily II)